MRYAKLIILMAFLMVMLSIGAASAANQTDDSITVDDESSDVILESENSDVLSSSNQTVTSDNFFDYFDEGGNSKTGDDLIFEGEFDSPVSHITINSPKNVYGRNATFKNMGINIIADDVTVNGLTLNSDRYVENEEGALIYAYGSGIVLQNIVLNYNAGEGQNAYGIFFDDCNDFKLLDSKVNFEASSRSEFYQYGIKMIDCMQGLIQGNSINVSVPLLIVNYGEEGLDQDYPLGIGIGRCEDIAVKNNDICTDANALGADYATLVAVLVFDSSDISFTSNNITETDFITPEGSPNCLYAFYLNRNRDAVVIERNNIYVKTNGGDESAGTAYAMQSMLSDVRITGNNITCISKGPNIGVYATKEMGGEGTIEEYIADNIINVTGFASSTNDWALVTGIEIQIGNAKIYNNSIYTHNIGEYDDKVYCYGVSYAQWIDGERSLDIQDNTIVTNGKYTISTIATKEYETTPVRIKNNSLTAHDLTGDDSIQLCGGNSTIPDDDNGTDDNGTDDNGTDDNGTEENVTGEMTITANNVWVNQDNLVTVTISNATGTISISINGKSYSVNLIDGVATKTLPAGDLILGENTLTVTYNALQNSTAFKVLNGIIDKNNVLDYFDQSNNGKLYDFIPQGVTLDFQGEIKSSDVGEFNIYINKAVNMISSTADAYIDLNTTAGSYEASNPGNRFTIDKDGSRTNVTGITFHNTQVWLYNTDYVTLDNISVIVLNQRVGSGVGVTSIRQNSTYITVKNSYFSTYNNGGSSSLVLGWANYCTIENNIIRGEGNVGNLFYLNTYNVDIPQGALVNSYNRIVNNTIYGPSASSAICRAICYMGTNNLIENNTIYYKGEGFTPGDNAGGMSNVIISNNKLYDGSTMSLVSGVDAHDNYVSGKIILSKNACIYNTVAGGLSIRGDDVSVINSTINGAVTLDAVANAQIRNSNITGDISLPRYAENNLICDCKIIGTVTVKGVNNVIDNNYITSSSGYAVVMTDSKAKDNNVTNNYIYSSNGYGNDAVNTNKYNLVINNFPKNTPLEIDIKNIKVGEIASVKIWVNESASGSVKVIFGGVENQVTMNNGFGTFDIPDLAAGNYTVEVIFSGNGTYAVKNKTFTVSKYDISIDDKVSVEVPDRGNPSFTVDLGSDVSGNVTVTVNNTNYYGNLVNGKATVTLIGLEAGSYHATITYSGDNKYNSASATRDFITKAEPDINVTVADIRVGEVAYISVSADSRIGSVIVVLNGNRTLNLSNGKGTLPVSDLTYGNYTVYVVFSGNRELLNKTVNSTFKVLKNDVSPDAISMVNDFKSPEFTISLNGDATGNLTVTVNSRDYSQNIVSGKASVKITDLAPNTYNATVTYSGDSKYNSQSKEFTFVIKAEPTISIDVNDILVGDIAQINITADNGIGSVKVILNGEHTVEITNGKGNISIYNLSAGKYTVKVIFEGNDNFFEKEVSQNMTVSKHQLTDIFNQNQNNFTVSLPMDAAGMFIIKIGENTYNSSVVNGSANIIVDDLNPGDYDVLMTYSGDDKYANASEASTLNVSKWPSSVSANVTDINVGDDAVFDIEVDGATGNVSVIVDGKKYNGTLTNGKVQIIIPNLANGTYDAAVIYDGDNNYLGSEINRTFTVSKVNIAGEWFRIDQLAVIISLPGDATGKVSVNVNNATLSEDVIGGNATLTLELTPGTYNATISYSGDNKFNGISGTAKIVVPKYETPISVSVNDVLIGESVKFTIALPQAVTGNVSVIINGRAYNGTLNDGLAIVVVDNLGEGNYTAEIRYAGDENYLDNQTTSEFRVLKKFIPDPDKAISVQGADSANPIFSIDIDNATGNFTAYLDGSFYKTSALENGKATIQISDLNPGKHEVNLTYSGDARFEAISKEVTVNVPAPHVPVIELAGSDVTMLYTSGSKYKVRLTSDGKGLSGKTIVFTVNGKTSKSSTDKDGYASVIIDLPPKSSKYSVTATYLNLKTSNKVKVNGIVTAKNVNVKKSKKVNKIKVTLKKVNGKYLKFKKLTLKINGKKLNAKTNSKGVATFKVKKNVIKKLKVGKKYKYTVTYLKETVSKKITVKK